jgi:hypothetical protein
MAARIVDVFLKDVLVRTYELAWDITHAPAFDQDFIDRARQRMREENFTNQEIAEARFSLRD